jgi:hypothetical protein
MIALSVLMLLFVHVAASASTRQQAALAASQPAALAVAAASGASLASQADARHGRQQRSSSARRRLPRIRESHMIFTGAVRESSRHPVRGLVGMRRSRPESNIVQGVVDDHDSEGLTVFSEQSCAHAVGGCVATPWFWTTTRPQPHESGWRTIGKVPAQNYQ